MRYLVTGGCGFIGSHLSQSLIEKGHEVVILDNLSTGKLENAPSRAEVIIGDVSDYNTVESALSGMDGCFHLAAVASVEKSVNDWSGTHRVNSSATVNIFQAASRNNRIPVVYTSSAAVYGSNTVTPLSEEARTVPITAYGVDKLSCEYHASVAWLVHRIPNIGVRPFNVYGPKQDPYSPYSGVISIFAERIMNGKPVTIYGDGTQIRDFIYVGDIVRIFMLAMENIKEGYDIINGCTGRATNLNQLIETIEEVSGIIADKTYTESRRGDIKVSIGDPTKLRCKYNFVTDTDLKEGLSLLILGRPLTVRSTSTQQNAVQYDKLLRVNVIEPVILRKTA